MKAPKRTSDAEAVMTYLREHPNARRGEIRAATGLSEAAVGNALEWLCDAGRLVALRDPEQPNWYRYAVPSEALAAALAARDSEIERLRRELAEAHFASPVAAVADRLEAVAVRVERALRQREAPAPRSRVTEALAVPEHLAQLARAVAVRHGLACDDPAWVLATVSNRLLAAEGRKEAA